MVPVWRSFSRLIALVGIALLLADEGETERAIELYALASRHPFVANSRWFDDVIGREIATIAATLPPDVVQTAKARGQTKDLWPTAADLIEELSDLGQNRSPRPTTMSQQ